MPVPTALNYHDFVQFAAQQMRYGNDTAIARADKFSPLTKAHEDKVGAFRRAEIEEKANDTTRDIFRDSVAKLFGGDIPPSVVKAMQMDDYGKGKPLTARRIAIVDAEVARVAGDTRRFNEGVLGALLEGKPGKLPENIRNALGGVVEKLRNRFGDKTVPPGVELTDIVDGSNLETDLKELVRSAGEVNRTVTAEELAKAFSDKAADRIAANLLGNRILELAGGPQPGGGLAPHALGMLFDKRVPDSLRFLGHFTTAPSSVDMFLSGVAAGNLKAFASLFSRGRAAAASAETAAAGKLAGRLGLDARLVAAHFPLADLRRDADDLLADILAGRAPGSKEEGYDVQAAFDKLVDSFVSRHADTHRAVDALGLPDDLAGLWKAEFAGNRLPEVTPAQLLEAAKTLDTAKVKAALAQGLTVREGVTLLAEVADSLAEAIGKAAGKDDFAKTSPVDGLMPLFAMAVARAGHGDKALAAAVDAARENMLATAMDCAGEYQLPTTGAFVGALLAKGGTAPSVPPADKGKFLAIAEADVEKALSGCGVKEAKVLESAKKTMLARASDAFAAATGLKGLSDFLAPLGEETVRLAKDLAEKEAFLASAGADVDKALSGCGVSDAKVLESARKTMLARASDVFAAATGAKGLPDLLPSLGEETVRLAESLAALEKCRAGAKDAIATGVAKATGLGKAYVLHHLDTAAVDGEAGGKLRFVRDGILEAARAGKPLDTAAALAKAEGAIAKFAQGKTALLKEIAGAGFDPVERASHVRAALHDRNWRDPALVAAAKGLAANRTVKTAAGLLARALAPEAVASLDDLQLRDVFLAFSKTFLATLAKDFPACNEELSGESDHALRVQTMTIQLLGKERTELAESFARLAGSGRLARLDSLLSEGLAAVHGLKLDYMMVADKTRPEAERENARLFLEEKHPGFVFKQEDFDRCAAEDRLYGFANRFFAVFADGLPREGTFDADAFLAAAAKMRQAVARHAGSLPEETLHVLPKLVRALDWRGKAAETSARIVDGYAADMKTWRDVSGGSEEAKGLEEVLGKRMNAYLAHLLAGNVMCNDKDHPGLYRSFLDDLPRNAYSVNGKPLPGRTLAERIGPFLEAIPDPAKRKAVSFLVNQQLFGSMMALSSRRPLSGWGDGENKVEELALDKTPGIGNFASRDAMKTGYPLFGKSQAEYALDVAEDGKSVRVRAKSAFSLHADISLPAASTGTCTIAQDFVIDFTGEKPAVRDFRLDQTFSA